MSHGTNINHGVLDIPHGIMDQVYKDFDTYREPIVNTLKASCNNNNKFFKSARHSHELLSVFGPCEMKTC